MGALKLGDMLFHIFTEHQHLYDMHSTKRDYVYTVGLWSIFESVFEWYFYTNTSVCRQNHQCIEYKIGLITQSCHCTVQLSKMPFCWSEKKKRRLCTHRCNASI